MVKRHYSDFRKAINALLLPHTLGPAEIKRLRLRCRISQPVFARYLNTSESTVKKVGDGSETAGRDST
jgi:putative transcriptional regulator